MKASEKVFCLVFSIGAMILLISVFGYSFLYFTKSTNIEKENTEQIEAKSCVQHSLDTKDTPTFSTTKSQTTTDKTSMVISTSNVELENYYQCDILDRGLSNMSEIGDGVCNDHFNHAKCQFDEGDCCIASVNTSACTICQCFDETPCKSSILSYSENIEVIMANTMIMYCSNQRVM